MHDKHRFNWLLPAIALMLLTVWGCPPPPPPLEVEQGVTVSLSSETQESDLISPRVSTSAAAGNHLRWFNETGELQTIEFVPDNWPFMESFELIEIEAGHRTQWYTMKEGLAVDSEYPYDVSPFLNDTGPGEPVITADP